MNSNWHGLMKVLEIKHVRNGEVLWEAKNLNNLMHLVGDQYFLDVLFAGEDLPDTYYLGLDGRTSLSADDTIEDLVNEPSSNGYTRQPVSSSSGWRVEQVSNVWRAIGNIITFSASGGSWGPVGNLFLTTEADSTGVLIASVALDQQTTVSSGDSVSMRLSLSMRDYPL
jgi:hypothetical protein